jgi:hypothetical protein
VGPMFGVMQDIPTCEVLLKRIEKEAIETIARIQELIRADSKLWFHVEEFIIRSG